MKNKILQLIDAYWKFDDNQQPMSSWHDKQDLLKTIQILLQSRLEFNLPEGDLPDTDFMCITCGSGFNKGESCPRCNKCKL